MSSGCDLSCALMVGMQSVAQCTAWLNLASLGAIGRVVVTVRLENGMQSVSRCSARDLLAGPEQLQYLHSQ